MKSAWIEFNMNNAPKSALFNSQLDLIILGYDNKYFIFNNQIFWTFV
jgi:hypothetical protein